MSQASRRHPSAVYLLCLIEGCERFACGALLSLFALYLTEHRQFADSTAILIIGGFLACTYLASWPCGWLADRWLGALGAARAGVVLTGLGYVALWTDATVLFWPALGLVVLGQGLFRPAISTLLSQLYVSDDSRREAGFGLFYISVNLGYLAGPLFAELARARSGWPAIFSLATAALLVASGLLAVCSFPTGKVVDAEHSERLVLPRPVERARLRALCLICAIAIVFWLALQQTGTSLPLFAEKRTNLHWSLLGFSGEAAPGYFATLHGGLVLVLTPLLLWSLARLRALKLSLSTPVQFVGGLLVTAGAFSLMSAASLYGGNQGRAHIAWLLGCYMLLSIAEVLFSALGTSFVTKVAPPRFASRMSGIWYASIAVGQLIAGAMGPLWQHWPQHRYFGCIALLCLIAAAGLLVSLRWLDAALPDSPSNQTQPKPEADNHASG